MPAQNIADMLGRWKHWDLLSFQDPNWLIFILSALLKDHRWIHSSEKKYACLKVKRWKTFLASESIEIFSLSRILTGWFLSFLPFWKIIGEFTQLKRNMPSQKVENILGKCKHWDLLTFKLLSWLIFNLFVILKDHRWTQTGEKQYACWKGGKHIGQVETLGFAIFPVAFLIDFHLFCQFERS